MSTVKKYGFYLSLILIVALTFTQCSDSGKDSAKAEVNFDWNSIPEPTDDEPVTVGYHYENIGDNKTKVFFHTKVLNKWHVYSSIQEDPDGLGPEPTEIYVLDSVNVVMANPNPEELGESINHFDPNFDMDVNYFEGKVSFVQVLEATNTGEFDLPIFFSYMMCDDTKCMFPMPLEIVLAFKGGEVKEIKGREIGETIDVTQIIPNSDNVDLENPETDCGKQEEEGKKSYWTLFFLGLAGGLISLITPCVFPMIPLTVSFFTKGGNETSKGIGKALLYGLAIVAVYVICSLPFYAPGTDPEVLNQISTSFTLNIVFFVIFLAFAFSFFGYYELTLPASWANKADKAADIGGILGVIFMALVLAIVSFSCTGPLLGSVLASSLKDGPVPITVAMLGFGIGLGLPFTIFAAFPSLLKSLPKSGGWLNTVKVVLGFVELGLAVKFLSNADFVYRFGILHRETFFLIWLILSLATAAYLFGLFRFPHDSKNQKISTTRKVIGMIFLLFGIYVAPGVMPAEKQPWRFAMISGFPPSTWYSWYEQDEEFHVYTDYNEALAAAKAQDKHLFIDFTGYACVNCRKMEENVWVDPKVKALLEEKYVIVSLYVDDKVQLPEELQGEVEVQQSDGTTKFKPIKSVGDKWSTYQSQVFHQQSQPYYAILDGEGKLQSYPVAYTPDEGEYADWLACSIGVDADEVLKESDKNKKENKGDKESH